MSRYSQATAAKDIASVMRHLKIRKAHEGGFSMGADATLHFGLGHARLAHSITVVVGVGYGLDSSGQLGDAGRFESLGTAGAIKQYQVGPARVQFQNKDPRGFREFCAQFAEHSALGSMNTLRGVQARRPALYDLEAGLRKMKVPTHVITLDFGGLAPRQGRDARSLRGSLMAGR